MRSAPSNEVLAALLERERTGRGSRLVVSMTDNARRLVDYRLHDQRRLLTGGLACYRIYETADGRHVTVAALEPKFFVRLCELLERPELAARQGDADQEPLAAELAAVFATRPLAEWLELFDGEDACRRAGRHARRGASAGAAPRRVRAGRAHRGLA